MGGIDRRQDVGSKMFIGIVTAILTTIFLGALGISIRSSEMNNMQEVRLAKLEVFAENQNNLNKKMEDLIDELRMGARRQLEAEVQRGAK